MPTAIVTQGAALGVIVAVPTLNFIIVNHSWHWAFGALGVRRPSCGPPSGSLLGREGTLVDAPVGGVGLGRGARALPPSADLPDHPRRLLRGFASYWGLGARPHLVHLLSGRRAWATARRSAAISASCPWVFGLVVVIRRRLLSQRLKTKGVSSRLCRGGRRGGVRDLGGLRLPFVAQVLLARGQVALLVFGRCVRQHDLRRIPMIVSELKPLPQRAGLIAITTRR
jgi:hypothetical protein